jgi:hypothetical protein
MYGPLVLAGALGTENFPETDILEDHQKLNNYPGIIVPTLVTNDSELAQLVSQVNGLLLTFETKAISQPGDMKCKLIPFYALHHQRYTIYWTKMTKEEYSLSQLASPDYQQRLDKVTLDTVNPNEQQSEIDHIIKSENSTADYFSAAGKGWRESNNAGYFSYQMGVNPQSQMYLVVTYWGSDRECFRDGKKYLRNFNISIDNNVISNEILNENKPYTLYDEFYAIPQQFTKDKSKIEVRFSCDEKSVAGRVFGIRITTEKI